jgi:hypothetical protein
LKARRLGALAAVLVAAGCASAKSTTAPVIASAGGAMASETPPGSGADVDESTFASALAKAAAEPGSVRLRVDVAGRIDADPARLSLLGKGVGIWNASRQIALPDEKEREVLSLLLEGNFARLDRVYGGRESDRRQPPVVRHSVAVEIDDHVKSSVQLVAGEQFAPLADLVARLLATGRALAADGIEVADVPDGLGRVADGTLATGVWGFVAQSIPGGAKPCDGGRFWLRLEVGRLEAAAVDCDGAIGERRRLDLSDDELRRLAAQLASHATALESGTVRASEAFELAVEVLGHRRSLQARPQSSRGSEGAPARDAIHDALRGLAGRVLGEGRPIGTP